MVLALNAWVVRYLLTSDWTMESVTCRRGRGVEHVSRASGEIAQLDELLVRVLIVLGDDVVLAVGAVLIAERLQRLGVGEVGRGGVRERWAPENQDDFGADDHRSTLVGRVARARETDRVEADRVGDDRIPVPLLIDVTGRELVDARRLLRRQASRQRHQTHSCHYIPHRSFLSSSRDRW